MNSIFFVEHSCCFDEDKDLERILQMLNYKYGKFVINPSIFYMDHR